MSTALKSIKDLQDSMLYEFTYVEGHAEVDAVASTLQVMCHDECPNLAFCCRGFRLRILSKSQDSSFCIFAVLILAQGFS